MNFFPCRIDESAPSEGHISDLRLVDPEEIPEEGWLTLGREPFQLLVDGRRQLLSVVYRQGGTSPLTSLAVFPQNSKPDRRIWSRAHSQDFRSASKSSSAEAHALWLRRGSSHPPLRRLAIVTGQWSDVTATDWVELRSEWRSVPFEFSDTLADFALLAFSTR